jgi:hypothetical protein
VSHRPSILLLGRGPLEHPSDDYPIPRLGSRWLEPPLDQGFPDLPIRQAAVSQLLGPCGEVLGGPPPAGWTGSGPATTFSGLPLRLRSPPGRPPRTAPACPCSSSGPAGPSQRSVRWASHRSFRQLVPPIPRVTVRAGWAPHTSQTRTVFSATGPPMVAGSAQHTRRRSGEEM